MRGADNAKKRLIDYNQERYDAFILNSDASLSLPRISFVPWVGASRRHDRYKKIVSHNEGSHHLKFILKNDKTHAFLWQTNAEQLKQAVRWGIVKTQSITGKVIASLGQYRVVSHGRVAKGMVSNAQAAKIKLLDLFQDRFEALQDVESLVNKSNTVKDYTDVLTQYMSKLQDISEKIESYFEDMDASGLDTRSLIQIRGHIQADVKRTLSYLNSLKDKDNLRAYDRAKGEHSIMEFVKQQMIHGLYELQGINQDMTYSSKRYFALTRGELNDFIEDARKDIDDHQADLRNEVTARHHGLYAADDAESLFSYDFSKDGLTPAREREVMLAISFIEKWDTLQHGKKQRPTLSNASGTEPLKTMISTRWTTHRNWLVTLKSNAFYILNIIKGMFVSTRPWAEEPWINKRFRLFANKLRKHSHSNDPMWRKPYEFIKQLFYAITDIFAGVYDFGAHLLIRMPTDMVNDWSASQPLASLESTLTGSSNELKAIQFIEKMRLASALKRCNYKIGDAETRPNSKLAEMDYTLTAGEQNDILTAITRGLNKFAAFFSHNIYAKDPVCGLLFTAAYAVGAGAIYFPSLTASMCGTSYVNWFSSFSHKMGGSNLAAVITGGSTQAQVVSTGWDTFIHGPSGLAMNTLYQCGEDPLTIGAYFLCAYGIGYTLVNGVNGHPIPWLSKHLAADLGTMPETGYPFIGAKMSVMLYEALVTEPLEHHPQPTLSVRVFSEPLTKVFKQLRLAHWLFEHAKALPKLDPRRLFAISRQIDLLFNKEDSASLKKLIYPQVISSIAVQFSYIPLAYFPATLRVLTACFLCLAAWLKGNPYPLAPLKGATNALILQAKKDLSRLIVFVTQAVYLPYTLVSSLLKMASFTMAMTVGRIAGLFNAKPAQFMYGFLASVHVFFRGVGEFFYPARALKSVAVAHPTHTIKKIEASYLTLLKQMGQADMGCAKDASIESRHIPFLPKPVFAPTTPEPSAQKPSSFEPA